MRFMMAAAVVALASVSLAGAQGGGNPSPFAGTYTWNGLGGVWDVTISAGGQIKGALTPSFPYTKGSLSGQVGADGSYSFLVSVTSIAFDFDERPNPGGPKTRTGHYKFMRKLAFNTDGNIVGTPEVHEPFTWVRQ